VLQDTLAMAQCTRLLHHVLHLTGTLLTLLVDVVHCLRLWLRPAAVLAAENLFRRQQLAFYQERHVKPRRATDAARFTLVWLACWFDWRQAVAVVQPVTCMRWHRQGFRLFWRWKSHPGRPPIPADLQALLCRMAQDNPTWGEACIANELLLRLGLRVSPRPVRKYGPQRLAPDSGQRIPSQRWRTCVHTHAQAIVAWDCCLVVTATCCLLYGFVVMEHATRRILHTHVTAHPTAPWTLQQLRETMPADHGSRFLVQDRDRIVSPSLAQRTRHLGLQMHTPPSVRKRMRCANGSSTRCGGSA
jgi:hypothetical protein